MPRRTKFARVFVAIVSVLSTMSAIAPVSYAQGSGQNTKKTGQDKSKSQADKEKDKYNPFLDKPLELPEKTNPLVEPKDKDNKAPVLPDEPLPLPDYRQKNNPDLQRNSKTRVDELPLFGLNYFEPARRAIQARRAYFERIISGRTQPVAPKTTAEKELEKLQSYYDNPSRPLSQEEKDAVASLTSAQQLDLLLRQRDGKLTDSERVKYRALLNPPAEDESSPTPGPTPTVPDESEKLTTEQKLALIQRQRAGKLKQEEKLRYRKLLGLDDNGDYLPNSPSDGSQTSGGRSKQSPNDNSNRTTPGGNGTRYQGGNGLNGGTGRQNAGGFGQYGPNGNTIPGGFNQNNRDGFPNSQPGSQNPSLDTNTLEGISARQQAAQDLENRTNGFGTANAFNVIVDPIAQLYQNVSASVPVNYQLAGGDKIILRVSSPVLNPIETQLTVDPMGAVQVPNVGRMVVLGQTLSQAETAIAARLVRMYKNAQISLSLKELRTIPVTVAGESFAPGTYQVPAVTTAFNLLYATGGPSDDGSMRTVEVRRRGNLAGNHTIDFYKFLLTGDQSSDIALEAGDVIYIPGRQGLVTVNGEVRRPARFEMTPQESLKDLLKYAGGIKPSGVSQRIQVATVQPGSARLLKDVDVSAVNGGAQIPVYDGDSVDVFSVRETLTNVVSIEGAVDQPGQYAITPNMTVADLIIRARGLLSEAYPGTAQLYRWNPDNTLTLVTVNLEKAMAHDAVANIPLTRWDRLTVFTREEVSWTGQREVTIRGAVKKPGIYYRSDNMRVKDLLMLAGGTLPEAYTEQAYLLHQKPDGTFSYDFVSLNSALKDDARNNALIQDKDVLAVYRSDEARFTPLHQFNIQGEVVTPGTYARGDSMKLSDAVKIAGGFTPRAGDKVLIAHARGDEGAQPVSATYSTTTAAFSPDPSLLDGDVITIQGRGSYQEKPYVVNVIGAVNKPGPVVLSGPKVRLSEVIKQAGGLKEEAYPEGVEFYRNPTLLTTTTQNHIAGVVNKLNDILNQAERERERARADIERIKAIGKAGQASSPLAIPGITTGVDAPNPALAQGTASIFTHELVSPARQLTADDLMPHGNVALDLSRAMKQPGSDDDLLMLDGDAITVPVRPTTVTVMGAVVQSRGVVYRQGAKLDYYLTEVGGYTEDAAKNKVLVIRVGGGLAPIKQVKQFKPGDIIFVPTKVLAADINKRQTDYDSIFRSLTSSALIFFVAKKLLGF